jgi:DNA-binding response OmpR family regulator
MNVLLVEDDERIVEFVRRGLETEGHVIDVAHGGVEALRRAQAQNCQVWRGTRPVQLTPKEFALLECLMRTSGKVVSRPQILEKVWGCSRHPLTNVVEVYIRHLRRKVDQDAQFPLIETVRGFGYRIRDQEKGRFELSATGDDPLA